MDKVDAGACCIHAMCAHSYSVRPPPAQTTPRLAHHPESPVAPSQQSWQHSPAGCRGGGWTGRKLWGEAWARLRFFDKCTFRFFLHVHFTQLLLSRCRSTHTEQRQPKKPMSTTNFATRDEVHFRRVRSAPACPRPCASVASRPCPASDVQSASSSTYTANNVPPAAAATI